MRKLTTFAITVLAVATLAAPAAATDPHGILHASFQAGVTGGETVYFNPGQASVHAAPGIDVEGRISPFGTPQDICDEQVVGTWAILFGVDKDFADEIDVSFALDGAVLDIDQTATKPVANGPFKGDWWYAAGVPVIGTLDAGPHVLVLTVDWPGAGFFEFTTPISVDAASC